jgi:hypothetical protein
MRSGGTCEEESVVVRWAIIIGRVGQEVESERRTRQAENKNNNGGLVRARRRQQLAYLMASPFVSDPSARLLATNSIDGL